MKRLRMAVFALGAAGLAATFVAVAPRMPPPGTYHGAYGEVLNAVAVGERHATDVVAAVNFDYRALDTLGEEFILFASVVAVAFVLRSTGKARVSDEERAPPRSDAVRLLGVGLVPLTVGYGLYTVTHGQVSPGGGFQGGVILATAPLVIFLCAGAKPYLRIAPPRLAKAAEAVGTAGYVAVGVLGLLVGKKFLENVLPLGTPGDVWSGGIIDALNVTVGLAVAAGFVELLSSFVEELLE